MGYYNNGNKLNPIYLYEVKIIFSRKRYFRERSITATLNSFGTNFESQQIIFLEHGILTLYYLNTIPLLLSVYANILPVLCIYTEL